MFTQIFTHMFTQIFTFLFTHMFLHLFTHKFTHVYTHVFTHFCKCLHTRYHKFTHMTCNFTYRHPPSQPSAYVCACFEGVSWYTGSLNILIDAIICKDLYNIQDQTQATCSKQSDCWCVLPSTHIYQLATKHYQHNVAWRIATTI